MLSAMLKFICAGVIIVVYKGEIMKYILALDQGTTSSRAILFDEHGRVAGKAYQEFRQIYPRAGWVEHDPKDILGSQVGVIAQALVRAGASMSDVQAIGVSNQRETTLAWDSVTGEPVCNAIVWQCRRTADMCDRLKEQGLDKMIYRRTGLVADAYFSATKMRWILDNAEGARALAASGRLRFGTVDTYLMYCLSGGRIFATDYTNAARTMLFNIHTLDWDDELLALFGISRAMLPEVYPSGYRYGRTDAAFLGRELDICAVAGDQQAALFGHLCTDKGDIKNTYGTGCFLLMNTGREPVESDNGLITSLAAGFGDRPDYILEGSVFVGGAAVQWLRDEMRLISSAGESEELALRVPSSDGVYVVPAFTGLGAPYWDARARGAIVGITRGTSREHIVRATLEGIAYQVADIVRAMGLDAGVNINRLRVDGGASANNFLMSFQADVLGCTVIRPVVIETTALGAAYLAGIASGMWSGVDELKNNERTEKEFAPSIGGEERARLLKGWRSAVAAARTR